MPKLKRAVKGSIDGRIPLRLPAELRRKVLAAATAAGLSMAEWIRQAISKVLP